MASNPKKTTPKVKNPPQGPNPWDVAPILPQGDPEPEPLWLAVGKALTAWEKLDQVQAQIFGVIVGSRRGGASAAYGVVVASSARSEMVAAAAAEVLQDKPEYLADVTAMVNRVGKLSGRRNDIAHGVVGHFTGTRLGKNDEVIDFDDGCFLTPASYATRKRNKDREIYDPANTIGKYAYTAAQIEEYGSAFHREYGDGVKLMFRLIAYFATGWPLGAHQPRAAGANGESPGPTG